MVIGVPKELDNKKVASEVVDFSKKYKLTKTEQEELTFIMNTFCKYYNKMSESDQMLKQTTIIESFEGVLETITTTYNGTGTQTRADIYWKQLPCIMKMLTDSNAKSKDTDSGTKSKGADSDSGAAKKASKSSSSSNYSPSSNYLGGRTPSYGGCGSSSYGSSSSYSYGGCGGGGGGGSYGSYGHC